MVGLFQELLEGIQADRGIGWQGWGVGVKARTVSSA